MNASNWPIGSMIWMKRLGIGKWSRILALAGAALTFWKRLIVKSIREISPLLKKDYIGFESDSPSEISLSRSSGILGLREANRLRRPGATGQEAYRT